MEAQPVESAVEIFESAVHDLDADRFDRESAYRLITLFGRAERAAAGAAAVLARRIGDPRLLARQQGTTVTKARAVLGLSERLADTPVLAGAVRAGGVSLDQATEIAKAETDAPGCADTLVQVAQQEPFHELRHQARRARLAHDRSNIGARQHGARGRTPHNRSWLDPRRSRPRAPHRYPDRQ
ncbi:MAG: hypothetical protein WBV06_15730 [Acidimicrobiia bacterium]